MQRFWNRSRLSAVALGMTLLLGAVMLRSDDVVIQVDDPVQPVVRPPATVALDPNTFPLDFLEDRTELKGEADFQAYYGLLDYVRRVPPEELYAAAVKFRQQRWQESPYRDRPIENFPLFYDLSENPDIYRGQPLAMRGHLQLHRVRHEDNRYDLDTIHEAYLYTDDSQGHPITVIFTENPDNIPAGETVVNGVAVTGYFFKLYIYHSRDGKPRYSPLIIAKEMRWTPAQGGLSSTEQTVLLTALGLGVVGVFILVRITRRRDAAARQRERQLFARDDSPDFGAIDDSSTP